jgi:hypothetical protein
MLSSNPNFEMRGQKFLIRHYAGEVTYNVPGMTEKNKDALIKDILDLVESSKDPFLHTLFPDKIDPDSKKRPPTAGDKIKVGSWAYIPRGELTMVIGICKCPGRESHEVGHRTVSRQEPALTFPQSRAIVYSNYQTQSEPIAVRIRRQGYSASDQVSRFAGEYPCPTSRIRVSSRVCKDDSEVSVLRKWVIAC